MLIVTTDSIPGKEIVEVKGLVKGSTVRSKHIERISVLHLRQLLVENSTAIMRCS